MTEERRFHMKALDIRKLEGGLVEAHIITKDNLRLVLVGGDHQMALLERAFPSEVAEP